MAGVRITSGLVGLHADLRVPPGASAVVLLAQAGGSVPPGQNTGPVRDELAVSGVATLVVDLVTLDEWRLGLGDLSMEVGELADRLSDTLDVVLRHPETRHLCPGCFANDTAAAAAFVAAAGRPATVEAIVSYEGRIDLAATALEHVIAPTLLVVGAEPHAMRTRNENAYERLRCRKRLELVPGAAPTAPEHAAAAAVARLAAGWFRRFLGGAAGER